MAGSWLRRVRDKLDPQATPEKPARSHASSTPAPAPAPARAPRAEADGAEDSRGRRPLLRLSRAVLADDALAAEPDEVLLEPSSTRAVVSAARRQQAQAELTERLSRGESLEVATVGCVHSLFEADARHVAGGLVTSLAAFPGGRVAHELGMALIAQLSSFDDLAYERFLAIGDDDIARFAAVEGVDAFLRSDQEEGRRRARAVAAKLDQLSLPALVGLAGRLLAVGDDDVARSLVAEAGGRDQSLLTPGQRRQLDVVAAWLEEQPEPDVPEGAAVIGVIDYHQPDQTRASSNVGDYVQTLAMLGNLARLSDCTFTGEGGLGDIITALQGRVAEHHPELVLGDRPGKVHLIGVNRDFSRRDPVPPGTWMVAFGWHMHSLFELRYDFPYHPNVSPLFVSFHLNRPMALTPQAIEYLRRHGPIGCRDWSTVDVLLSEGIDAFFTGCLTSTVNAVFPDREALESRPDTVGLIDVGPGAGAKIRRRVERVSHVGQEFREAGLAEGIAAADELLDRYQHSFARIVTSRLHSYLPATSLGIPVRFTPTNPADIRFDGLYGMEPGNAEFTAMRDGIRSLLAETLSMVAAGAEAEAVYARWRELTADRVAEARARHTADPVLELTDPADPVTHADTEAAHTAVTEPGLTDIALSLDQNLTSQLPVTLEALTANASGPLRLWIMCRGLDEAYRRWIADSFPSTTVNFLPCDHVEYGDITRMISHITISTMDRLLLPELLPQLDRITYIDIDAIVEGDVVELAGIDLGETALAARPSIWWSRVLWNKTGNQLAPEVAYRFRRAMSAKMAASLPTINAGILVMDLARMRADRFTAWALSAAATYGLNDQDLLLAYVGADRTDLDRRWNHWPSMENLDDPAVVHFVGAGKPWSPTLTPGAEVWERWRRACEERVGRPPAVD